LGNILHILKFCALSNALEKAQTKNMAQINRWFGEKKSVIQDSPLYREFQTDMSNGEHISKNLDADGSEYQTYSPFNWCQVTNNTNQTLILTLGGQPFVVPSGVIKSIEDSVNFRVIDLANLSGSTATGDVEILWQKVLTTNKILRKAL
jgi:hypothetical protein